MKKSELILSLKKLERAYLRLEEGLISVKDELDRDGVIQRYEFTFELLWKTIKMFLKHEGINSDSPREVFVAAFRKQWVINEELVLEMLEDRNITTHVYNEEEAILIFQRISKHYLPEMERLLKLLKSLME
ncbi:MAG: hypothetical protein A3H98_10000 [Bacteroidetes bacterium RIFCSPLOWO2_02_FULL_36_8]|nr:MAG: hypothetical protein A3H98_10000 [Bacteroidetes bacterium RIFCSPLOWO2_02_FULL_36_8]OFY70403.1 MAG: hypothetical protein A3G23_09765 [Bacteroidetes bacterium RIFCSPLOWO2_12_FULL_37_12]